MSKIKPGRAFAKEIFTSFKGLSETGADEMRNFRILADGSIEKRCGFSTVAVLPGIIRGNWQGSLDGIERFFAVCGTDLFTRDREGNYVYLRSLSTSEGLVHFFLYADMLYLSDGDRLYVRLNNGMGFIESQGYVPLFGVNWHPDDYGEVNEPMNLLTPRLRINYCNVNGSLFFRLPFYASSVESVRLDGVEIENYEFTSPGKGVTVPRVATSVDICFTAILENEHRARIHQAIHALCGRREGREYLLLAAANENGRYVYASSPVSKTTYTGSLAFYPDSDRLWFTDANVLTVGDESHPVTGFFSDRDRVLAFWAHGASSISIAPEGSGVECYPLLLGMGCNIPDPNLSLNGDPIVINEGGIFVLHATATDPDRFYPSTLGEIPDFWKSEHFRNNGICTADPTHGEIWFRDPTDTEGSVWVYSPSLKQWYVFDGIDASFFLSLNGKPGFASGSRIVLFDEALTTDDGASIEAVYRSTYLCFSSPESVKRSLRVTLSGFGAGAMLELESERCSRRFTVLPATSPDTPICLDKRARFGRFRHLRFCLRDAGSERSRWSRLALYSNL